MPIDFTRVRSNDGPLPSHPRDVFAALSGRKSGFGYLRDVQGQVLDTWYNQREERDVTIKMNTGTGKTVVGLLALLSSINDGYGPALYVAPDKFLVQQVISQAEKLGIQWTDEPDSTDYLSGSAICITNIHKLVNGFSIFGGPMGRRADPVPIGSLVIDDAHACVRTIEEQTTVCIPRDHVVYNEVLELFRNDLKDYGPAKFTDLESQVPGIVFRIPIWAWADRNSEVVERLNTYQDDEILRFCWPFVKDILSSCQAIFSSQSFEIQPLCPPTNTIISLEEAKRRLYLTATLADDSILITHFGVSESSAQKPVTPSSAADIGDRLILSPLELNPAADETIIRQAVRAFADDHNTVVLVPSYRHADLWNEYADSIAGAEKIDQVVASLKETHVGLVVLVNKYDGVDLPDNACRVLVIDGVPEAIGNSERREAEILGGSDLLAQRRLQRIEQGMGRGVRSAEDYCVVLLLGTSLSKVLARPKIRKRLGPATHAQLELSMNIAEQIDEDNLQELIDVIRQCLDREEGWLFLSRQRLAGLKYNKGSIEPFSTEFRRGFDLSIVGQFKLASDAMSKAVNSAIDDKSKGWLMEQLAMYQHPIDPVRAQHTLTGAIKRNPRVMRPVNGVHYLPTLERTDQSIASYNELVYRFENRTELILGFRELVGRLTFDTGATDFESALEELGTLLGFGSQRPERDTGRGPDLLWSLGNSKYLVIECKNEAKSEVWKRDAAQLAHSMSWFAEKYDNTCKAIPLLVHHSGRHAHEATPPPDARILDSNHLPKLCESVMGFAKTLASRSIFDRADIGKVLQHQGLTAGELIDRYTISPT